METCGRDISCGAFGFALSLTGMAATPAPQGIDDPRRADYFKTFAGKTIAFVPVTMGIDLTEGWASVMKKQADRLGMKFEVRDPHFSADAGAQALTVADLRKAGRHRRSQSRRPVLRQAAEARRGGRHSRHPDQHAVELQFRRLCRRRLDRHRRGRGAGRHRQMRRRHEPQGRHPAGPADLRVGQRHDEGRRERPRQTSRDQARRQPGAANGTRPRRARSSRP